MKETSLSVISRADNVAHTWIVPSFSSTATTSGMDTPTSAWEQRLSAHGIVGFLCTCLCVCVRGVALLHDWEGNTGEYSVRAWILGFLHH